MTAAKDMEQHQLVAGWGEVTGKSVLAQFFHSSFLTITATGGKSLAERMQEVSKANQIAQSRTLLSTAKPPVTGVFCCLNVKKSEHFQRAIDAAIRKQVARFRCGRGKLIEC